MSRKTYNSGSCDLCGASLSSCGLARAAHNRMHVKQGWMKEQKEWFGDERFLKFAWTEKGLAMHERLKAERRCAFIHPHKGQCRNIGIVETADHKHYCHWHQWSVDGKPTKPLTETVASDSTHSPGPWRIGDSGDSTKSTRHILDKDGHKVATVESFPATSTGKADANLIAVAPEMKDLLTDLTLELGLPGAEWVEKHAQKALDILKRIGGTR